MPLLADQPVAHRVLAVDKGHAVILNEKGEVEWEVPVKFTSHDVAVLPNGNFLLHMSDTKIVEMTPEYVKTRLELMLAERWTLQTLNGENDMPDPAS